MKRLRKIQTKKEKYQAVIDSIMEAHAKGQPVLVGTITIETSELLSSMLKKKGIKHNVLNAKYHEMEAQIVAEAGQHGAVTIATNMAGRGTDIKLDDEARQAGGLKIVGTERHESRRIDNQLRGRSGRQGDPGESKFYISLEDDLMRLFGSERMMNIFNTLGVADGEEIHHKMLSNAIERAQTKIENNNFGIRKNLGRQNGEGFSEFFERFDRRTCEIVFDSVHEMARNPRVKSKLLLTEMPFLAKIDDSLPDIHRYISI